MAVKTYIGAKIYVNVKMLAVNMPANQRSLLHSEDIVQSVKRILEIFSLSIDIKTLS